LGKHIFTELRGRNSRSHNDLNTIDDISIYGQLLHIHSAVECTCGNQKVFLLFIIIVWGSAEI
jgi:hypothetical protein